MVLPPVGGREHRPHPQFGFYQELRKIEKARPKLVQPVIGRRVYMSPGQSGVEGTGDFGRAYTLVVSPQGEVLHLNRFYDTAWAHVEVRCARRSMAEIKPGISFDLHESQLMGDGSWQSARHQPSSYAAREVRTAHSPGDHPKPLPTRARPCLQLSLFNIDLVQQF